MIETSSSLPLKCSAIFSNLRKPLEFVGNVRQRSCDLRKNFRESSEIFGEWSKILGKSLQTPLSVCLYNKKNITR